MWKLFRKKEVRETENRQLKEILKYLQRQEDAEIKLSIRAIIMYESLSGKMFSSVSDSPEDLFLLMYSAFVCSTGLEISVEAFAIMCEDEKFSRKLNKDLKRLQMFTAQFQEKEPENVEKDTNKKPEKVEVSVTDMADKLIFTYGVDADFVLNRMQMWELNHFLKGAEEHYKEKVEEQRLWTFLQVAPQIDLTKCKGPEDFLPLPWTKKEMEEKQRKTLESETKRAQSTLGMEIKLF